MRSLSVQLAHNAYSIHIETDFLQLIATLPLEHKTKISIITDSNVAPLYLNQVQTLLQNSGFQTDSFIFTAGESNKNEHTWLAILTHLIEQQHTRSSVLIALGGGVVGDLTGFAAACYQRGIRFIQIPTTLLAQVDSSVGGKTAINHALGKNLIGSFYQPLSVFINVKTLATLPQRDFSAGMAEVIKYGIIQDYHFFCWLETHLDALINQDEEVLKACIFRCCQLKMHIVQQDETEKNQRAILNLGHTFAHAIETATGLDTYLHGEAVSIGIVMACRLAVLMGQFTPAECERIIHLLTRAHLPTQKPKHLPTADYLLLMLRDKKALNNEIRLILPQKIGVVSIADKVPHELILQAIEQTI